MQKFNTTKTEKPRLKKRLFLLPVNSFFSYAGTKYQKAFVSNDITYAYSIKHKVFKPFLSNLLVHLQYEKK